jgi:hypothetical protein
MTDSRPRLPFVDDDGSPSMHLIASLKVLRYKYRRFLLLSKTPSDVPSSTEPLASTPDNKLLECFERMQSGIVSHNGRTSISQSLSHSNSSVFWKVQYGMVWWNGKSSKQTALAWAARHGLSLCVQFDVFYKAKGSTEQQVTKSTTCHHDGTEFYLWYAQLAPELRAGYEVLHNSPPVVRLFADVEWTSTFRSNTEASFDANTRINAVESVVGKALELCAPQLKSPVDVKGVFLWANASRMCNKPMQSSGTVDAAKDEWKGSFHLSHTGILFETMDCQRSFWKLVMALSTCLRADQWDDQMLTPRRRNHLKKNTEHSAISRKRKRSTPRSVALSVIAQLFYRCDGSTADRCIIDQSVYSMARIYRLLYSVKLQYGIRSMLRPYKKNSATICADEAEPDLSAAYFFAMLVHPVGVDKTKVLVSHVGYKTHDLFVPYNQCTLLTIAMMRDAHQRLTEMMKHLNVDSMHMAVDAMTSRPMKTLRPCVQKRSISRTSEATRTVQRDIKDLMCIVALHGEDENVVQVMPRSSIHDDHMTQSYYVKACHPHTGRMCFQRSGHGPIHHKHNNFCLTVRPIVPGGHNRYITHSCFSQRCSSESSGKNEARSPLSSTTDSEYKDPFRVLQKAVVYGFLPPTGDIVRRNVWKHADVTRSTIERHKCLRAMMTATCSRALGRFPADIVGFDLTIVLEENASYVNYQSIDVSSLNASEHMSVWKCTRSRPVPLFSTQVVGESFDSLLVWMVLAAGMTHALVFVGCCPSEQMVINDEMRQFMLSTGPITSDQ